MKPIVPFLSARFPGITDEDLLKAAGNLLPTATRVAWSLKKDDIEKDMQE